MGKVERVLTEVSEFLGTTRFDGYSVASGSLEPRGGKVVYTPDADNRLVGMMVHAKEFVRSDFARVKRVFDELAPSVRRLLAIACSLDGKHAEIGCDLPSARALAQARGLDVDVAQRRLRAEHERTLSYFYSEVRYSRGCTPSTLITAVLARLDELDRAVLAVIPTPADLRDATRLAIESGVIDVRKETFAVVEAACDAYLEMRDRLGATRREHKAAIEREKASLIDELLGKKKRKARERFKRSHCGELLERRDEIVELVDALQVAS